MRILGFAVLALLFLTGTALATPIDLFGDPQLVTANSGSGACSPGFGVGVSGNCVTSAALLIASGFPGTTRTLIADYDSGIGATTDVRAAVGFGLHGSQRDSGIFGQTETLYTLPGGITFSMFEQALGIHVLAADIVGGTITFYIVSSGTPYFSPSHVIPNTSLPQPVISFFSSWSSTPAAGDIVSNVGFYVMEDGASPSSGDFTFDNFVTTTPEPGSYLLIGGGLIGLAALCRRKKSNSR